VHVAPAEERRRRQAEHTHEPCQQVRVVAHRLAGAGGSGDLSCGA
jgi:hypothetical protein